MAQNLDQIIAECKAQIGETTDPVGTLSRLLKAKAPAPTIDHLVGREVLDSRGNPCLC